jgi:hypothetical protein
MWPPPELTKQLREGGVYERELRAIGEASLAVNNALEQRLSQRRG